MKALRLPRLSVVLFLSLFWLVVMLGPRLLNVDGDLGRHLAVGEYILDSRHIPTSDVFSHTLNGAPLTPHEWLSEVVFALAHRLLGLDGVVLLCAVLVASTFWAICSTSVRRSGLVVVSLGVALLAAAASSLHWLARPHLFTLLLTVLWIDRLERLAGGENVTWWPLPSLMLVWANLHGAFVFGFVVWLAYAADWVWRRWRNPAEPARHGRALVLVLVTSLGATMLNPVGPRLWETSLGYVGNAYLVGHTAEYFSPNFHDVSTWPFLVIILVSPWILAAARPIALRHILLLLGWTALGLYSVRHVAVYAVVAAPILSEALAAGLRKVPLGEAWRARERRLAELEARFRGDWWAPACVLIVAVLMARGVRLTPAPDGNAFSPRVFPVAAMDHVLEDLPGKRVFNYFPWGGYLLFRGWPQVQVFIDGQTDFYGEALTRQYETVITLGEGWEQVLDRYDVDWVIMPADSRLVRMLQRNAAWRQVYADATTAVLGRIR